MSDKGIRVERVRIRGCDVKIYGVWHASIRPVTYPGTYMTACYALGGEDGVRIPGDPGPRVCGMCTLEMSRWTILPEKEALEVLDESRTSP